MANTQDPNQSLKGLLSDHFFDIAGSTVTNVEQDENGDFVFHLVVRATSKKPGGGGGGNAKTADAVLFKTEDLKVPKPGTAELDPEPAPSGSLRKEDIINIAVAAATAAVAAAAKPADGGDKKPGGGGGHNAKAPDLLGTEQQ
ncbi:MAG TPA: hypothetical protein VL832_18745 [Puia sp.]|jgi:hypothetical protein|nr:hypothetical protein [Puia sp.]